MKTEVIYDRKNDNLIKFKEVECGSFILYKEKLFVKVDIIRNGCICANVIRIGKYYEYWIDEDSMVEVLDVKIE